MIRVRCRRLQAVVSQGATPYDQDMSKTVTDVLADALRLEPDARAEVAAELLASLDGPADPDADAAWDVEIERRIEAIESGQTRLEPWPEVKRRIERDVLGR
jgi:Putative addiction module component